MSDEQAEQAINAMLAGGRTLGHEEDEEFRISLAGAQEKIAFLRHQAAERTGWTRTRRSSRWRCGAEIRIGS